MKTDYGVRPVAPERPKRPPQPKKYTFKNFISTVLTTLYFIAAIMILGITIITLYIFSLKLPDIDKIQNYVPNETTIIYAADKSVLARLHDEENRVVVPLDKIPLQVQQAVLAMEDVHFYIHPGINPFSIMRSVISLFDPTDHFVKGGGSTITQQMARSLFLSNERTFRRKASEWVLATQLERKFNKKEILEMYLNQVYWGHNAYGVESAAKLFFGKSVRDLNLAEAAMMGGLLSSPEIYSPYKNMKFARWRQRLTLENMVKAGFITQEKANRAKIQPVKLVGLNSQNKVVYPYFTNYVIQVLKEHYNTSMILRGGLKVYTTIDPKAQKLAENVMAQEMPRLKKLNISQGALVSVEPRTGFIKAMVGGVDYKKSQFNRVTQAKRQVGSAFKPFVYLTAFNERVLTPDSMVLDAPITIRQPGTADWSPKNYSGNFSGPLSVRQAIQYSVNIPAVTTIQRMGPLNVIETAKAVGIKSKMKPYLSLALGSAELTPLEMASAYATFANGGKRPEKVTPIAKVADSKGFVFEDNTRQPLRQVYDPYAVSMLNDVLQTVVNSGTGIQARLPGRAVAGKTGTTSDNKDSWFIGYVPQLVTLVWVGNDNNTRMDNATGGTVCAPIWQKYMSLVTSKMKPLSFPKATLADSEKFRAMRKKMK
jgi:penicillin-binding protein 1A